MFVERYWQVERANLKHNILLHLLVCVLILGLSPLLMGVANLGQQDTAKVLEMYVALIGIVMLVPVFLPEQDQDIRDLVYTKYMKSQLVYTLRILGNVLILMIFLAIYIVMLKENNCDFPVMKYYFGTLAEMLFLGGMGLFFYGLTDNLVIGYMIPIFYYIVAIGSGAKYLKLFYPFSMVTGSYDEKVWLSLAGVILIGSGIWLRCRRRA